MKDDIRAGVYILAQNRLVREALSRILANKSDIVLVGSSSPSEASVQEIVATTPDVLVIDSFATGSSHLDFVHELQQDLRVIKLVVIGMDLEPQHFLEAIREGVMGYLAGEASALEVVAAVRTVAGGGAFCSSAFRAFLFRFATQQHQMPMCDEPVANDSRAHKHRNCRAPRPCGEYGAQPYP